MSPAPDGQRPAQGAARSARPAVRARRYPQDVRKRTIRLVPGGVAPLRGDKGRVALRRGKGWARRLRWATCSGIRVQARLYPSTARVHRLGHATVGGGAVRMRVRRAANTAWTSRTWRVFAGHVRSGGDDNTVDLRAQARRRARGQRRGQGGLGPAVKPLFGAEVCFRRARRRRRGATSPGQATRGVAGAVLPTAWTVRGQAEHGAQAVPTCVLRVSTTGARAGGVAPVEEVRAEGGVTRARTPRTRGGQRQRWWETRTKRSFVGRRPELQRAWTWAGGVPPRMRASWAGWRVFVAQGGVALGVRTAVVRAQSGVADVDVVHTGMRAHWWVVGRPARVYIARLRLVGLVCDTGQRHGIGDSGGMEHWQAIKHKTKRWERELIKQREGDARSAQGAAKMVVWDQLEAADISGGATCWQYTNPQLNPLATMKICCGLESMLVGE
ncbi:hypothetical protein B0H15DRAFT_807285 [Mycena belliarum]|uniref:Uncharacterized protein n=1 Tax=Mycena belliarum TaxID=1033014 RepID=A0AAD6TLF4_9AGAR|nr:hypothetical protein B0H15DRAFT_807285 [Mycena belliae]